MEFAKSFEFLDKKSESADVRALKALELLLNNQISLDTVVRWVSKVFSSDSEFRTSKSSWALLDHIVRGANFKADRFSIFLADQDLYNIYKSDFREAAFNTLYLLVTAYPNAWRPKYVVLMHTIKLMLEKEIYPNEVSFMMDLLLKKPEIIAAIDEVFQNAKTLLFEPLLNHAEEINSDLAFNLLSSSICIPFFVRKAFDKKGSITESILTLLNKCEKNSPLFAPYMIRAFFKQAKLLNFPPNMTFPLRLIEGSKSLDIAVPIIRETRILSVYSPQVDSPELKRLKELAQKAIEHKHSALLIELALIEFRCVQPRLNQILPNPDIATPDLFLTILKQCLLLRNVMIIFDGGDFPAHILSNPEFINQFCDGVTHMVSNQVVILLSHLVGYSNRLEESALLYWTIKSCRLTEERGFVDVVDQLVGNCFTNPWRFAAAVIASKTLQRQMPPPLPIVSDVKTHPVILDCFNYENYGSISLDDDLPDPLSISPPVPSPYMQDSKVYRTSFIIQNLPNFASSLSEGDLEIILRYVFHSSFHALSLRTPQTVADHCLCLLHNTMFYESPEIRARFTAAVLPLLPKGHLSSYKTLNISPEDQLRCAIVASMPPEFLSPRVSAAAFVGLFASSAGQHETTLLADSSSSLSVYSELKSSMLVDCLCNAAENLPKKSVQRNFEAVFRECADDAVEKLTPILLERLNGEFVPPTEGIERPAQIAAICEFCFEKGLEVPFEETLFREDIGAFCAQIKAGQKMAAQLLLSLEKIGPKEAPLIARALVDRRGGINDLPDDFLTHLIDSLCSLNFEDDIDLKESNTTLSSNNLNNSELTAKNSKEIFENRTIVSQFAAILPSELLLHFMDVAPLSLLPHILAQLTPRKSKEEFTPIEKHVRRVLTSMSPSLSVIKTLCSVRVAHHYSRETVAHLLVVILTETNKPQNLAGICMLCNCVVQLIGNCNRELSQQPTTVIEVVRKLSSLFSKALSSEKPTYKNMKQLAKMFSAVSKVSYAEYLQYLIASFVSHITNYQPGSEDLIKMRYLQTTIFPLFNRCTREQLNEVSTALHDSHREVFKQLSERWVNEAQYKGKV